jgi:GTPase KRas protein
MRDTYIRTGEGFLIAYAMTSRTSFDDAKSHYNQILRVKDSDKFPMVLCANKADLVDQRMFGERGGGGRREERGERREGARKEE